MHCEELNWLTLETGSQINQKTTGGGVGGDVVCLVSSTRILLTIYYRHGQKNEA